MENDAIQRGLAALRARNFGEAGRVFEEILRIQPRNLGALNLLSVVLIQLGRPAEAENHLRLALQENAGAEVTLYNYGIVLKALNRPAEALQRFSEALALNPAAPESWNNRGTVFNDLKRYDEAIADFAKAIELQPRYAEAFCNKGKTLALCKRLDEALAAFEEAAALKPDLSEAWLGHGGILADLKRYKESLADYDRAVASNPAMAEVWLGRGNALARLRRWDDALVCYDKAVTLNAKLAEAWLGRGNVLTDLKQHQLAFSAFNQALAAKPDLGEAWLGCGNVFADLGRYDDALAAFDRAAALQPNLAEIWSSRGNVFTKLQRYDEAFAAYDRAMRLDPEMPYVAGLRLNAKLYMSDWTDLEIDSARLLDMVREGRPVSVPFVLIAISSSPADQLQCARRYVQEQTAVPYICRGEIYRHDRIRVAYLSNNFHESAMTHLLAGMFELHDRSRFEVTAVSFGAGHDSPMRRRLNNAFEHFVDVHGNTDQEIAERMRRSEIDIAVDLMGFTADNRLSVLARHAAPIQVNYMGYPGTMGAPYIDYIIADRTVIPEKDRAFYSEQIVFMPGSYFITDDRLVVSDRTPTRAQCGLPESGFVFCCFNSNYKITAAVFDIWMRLLGAIDGSVLWLLEANSTATENLRRHARQRGISPERLIFAGKMPVADHLARHRLADLCIDTLPCNAHTTATDALWAGLPVVTCLGSTFAGRVAASLLRAADLPELVAETLEDYEALALKLARDTALLASVKDKLAGSRETCPLFDTAHATRSIEAAYVRMWERHQSGSPALSFAVGE